MEELTPQKIVQALDQHIIGQTQAKRAVAVAIRNRWRRRQLAPEMAREVYPKNIIMAGPTGVGKTEIARRLAGLTGSPFLKIEATKFTEVGYHGRDVESMIRDLLDQAINLVRAEQARAVREKAEAAMVDRLTALLLPGSDQPASTGSNYVSPEESRERRQRARERLQEQLAAGTFEEREVELTLSRKPQAAAMFSNMGLDQMDPEMANLLERLVPEQTQRRRVSVAEARKILLEEETDKLLSPEKITAEAIRRTEESGIIFLDEIDKLAQPSGRSGSAGSPDVSRQGVQRDLLPIVEGAAVTTRHGVVHTDHILFIAAGAFHSAAVSDLMPELQGRFPIRVELEALGRNEFIRVLTEPKNALTRQQEALLAVEGLAVTFEEGAIAAIADLAAQANATMENIGARRLMTIVEKVFDELNFDAPQLAARGESSFAVTEAFVREQVTPIIRNEDLSKFVL